MSLLDGILKATRILQENSEKALPARPNWIFKGFTPADDPDNQATIFDFSLLTGLVGITVLKGTNAETTGNFSRNANTNSALVICTAPGGPSGGAMANNGQIAVGGGGGAGGTAFRLYSRSDLSDGSGNPLVVPYTLGARGSGGTNTGGSGSGNTDSDFGVGTLATPLTAHTGGIGGGVSALGGTVDKASVRGLGGGTINSQWADNGKGQDAFAGVGVAGPNSQSTTTWMIIPSCGGASFWGGGGGPPAIASGDGGGPVAGNSPGFGGVAPGAGAGGAYAYQSASGLQQAAGARGGQALIVIVEFS